MRFRQDAESSGAGMNSQRKIFTSREELARALEERRKRGENIVFTNGCFDIIHPGHARLLRHARAQGDLLAVGVNDDASVSRLKGPHRPILPLEQRLRILAGFAAVDYVIAFPKIRRRNSSRRCAPTPSSRARTTR